VKVNISIKGTGWGLYSEASSLKEAQEKQRVTEKYIYSSELEKCVAKCLTEIMRLAQRKEQKRKWNKSTGISCFEKREND
jgi:hypothetical protein